MGEFRAGVVADDGDGLDFGLVDRKKIAGVLQQHDGVFRDLRAAATCSGDISGMALASAGSGSKTPVANITRRLRSAMSSTLDMGTWGFSAVAGLQERIGEEVAVVVLEAAAHVGPHFQVQPVVGGIHRAVAAAPVAHHQALEIPVLFEDPREQELIFRAVLAVDAVIAGHDSPDVAFGHGGLEGGEIDSRMVRWSTWTFTLLRQISWLFRAKCLAQAATPWDCRALIRPTAMRELRKGSSPRYSQLRPLSGVRMMFSPGPSMMFLPRLRASSPMTLPKAAAMAGSKEAAMPMLAGRAVEKSSL